MNLKILNGSHLKLIAILGMTCDHVAYYFRGVADFLSLDLFFLGSYGITPYFIMRTFGRMAFPLFSFLIVEGFLNTSNRQKYGRNLFFFAIFSELPWNLAHSNSIFCGSQNVFFTLLLGYLGLCCLDKFKEKFIHMTLCLTILFILSLILRADYGCIGFGFIIMLYLLRNNIVHMSVVGSCFLPSTWRSGLSFIPISMYNGKRGFVKGFFWKFSFYLFYPLHLLIIWFIKFIIC